ncbi:MAG TPA: DUF4149 domain-containing protein [Hydrogenophaga sp.]
MLNLTALRWSMMLAALWWGAITGMSFVAVPLMFAKLGPGLAGPVAAKLFSIQSWIGLALGLGLLLLLRGQRDAVQGSSPSEASSEQAMASMRAVLSTMGIVVFAMLLAMLQEFGVAQKIVTARSTGGDLRLWHGLGSVLVLGQWLCSATVLWRLSRGAVSR